MIYFIAANAVHAVKIGITADPVARLWVHQTHSPVSLYVAAVDRAGDRLTEAELHWRFRSSRMHGEWFGRTPEIDSVITETFHDGCVPGAWRFPQGRVPRYRRTDYGPTMYQLKRAFGLTRKDVESITCAKIAAYAGTDLPAPQIPALVFGLMSRGVVTGHEDFFHACDAHPPRADAA